MHKVLARIACLLTALLFCIAPAAAATPAETFISGNIQTGLTILNDKQLTPAQRATQFEAFLLGVTDLKRIALFTLGPAANTASPADRDAYMLAFQNYAIAVYQSYLAKYSGQTLTVLHSKENAPGDVIVTTQLNDPNGHAPLQIDFRVSLTGPKPAIVDFRVEGVWIALAQHDDFAAVLAKSNGDIPALIAHLRAITAQYH